jgi:D-alanyl-D-alanine carboxypeptidase
MIKIKLTFGLILICGFSMTCFSQIESYKYNALLDLKIDSMRIAYDFPSVAYGVIQNDTIIALNVLGFRDIETNEKAQLSDYFHLGSVTKSFTAFLSGRLVDEGKIDWNTKFFDLFPELKEIANPAYYDMNLQQLLSHRARLINFKADTEIFSIISAYEKTLKEGLSLSDKRYYLIKHILQKEPLPIYEKCDDSYSNAGFIAAALMLEKVSGLTWEKLIMKLSDDLNLDLYIGWPVDFNPYQPKGHINPKYWNIDIEKNLVPISDQLRLYHSFNQSNLLTSPSGNISIKTEKLLYYLQFYLDGINGENNYLKTETYKHILTTYPKYSHGWWIDNDSGVISYAHRGSNGTFWSFAGFFPQTKTGIVVFINTYTEPGLTDIIQLIMKTIE